MELETLRSEWMAREARLGEGIRLNALLLREAFVERHGKRVRAVGPGQWLERVTGIACLALLGWFISRHYSQPRFLAPALLLEIWTAVMFVTGILQRQALHELDLGGPVLATQSRLEQLRLRRLQTFKWAFLTGQLVWYIPFLIVLFKGLLGVDLYTASAFMPRFIAANVAAGLAFIPLAIWATDRHGPWLGRTRAGRHLVDAVAGRDIAAARDCLGRLARFEREAAQR